MGSSRRKLLTGGLLALGIAVPVVLAVEATHQATCDRGCLIELTNSYLEGVLAHRAANLSLSPDLKSTENGRPVTFGEGVWKSAKSLSATESFADASKGEAGVFGVLTAQDGKRSRVALRLKIDRRQLQSVETVVSPEADVR